MALLVVDPANRDPMHVESAISASPEVADFVGLKFTFKDTQYGSLCGRVFGLVFSSYRAICMFAFIDCLACLAFDLCRADEVFGWSRTGNMDALQASNIIGLIKVLRWFAEDRPRAFVRYFDDPSRLDRLCSLCRATLPTERGFQGS